MITKLLSLLAKFYPLLILVSTVAVWSISNYFEVAPFAAPPVADGIPFHWNPEITYNAACASKPLHAKHPLMPTCEVKGSTQKDANYYSSKSSNSSVSSTRN